MVPFIGEIRMFAGNFAPAGWAMCDGQLLPIAENEDLFQLIGTTYGGDGTSTFALPDLRGRIPIHQGIGFILAENGGEETVTLRVSQIPGHTHALLADAQPAESAVPAGQVLAEPAFDLYAEDAGPPVSMSPVAIGPVGGSQPHENCMPSLCVNFIISLYGIFPSPT